MNLEALKSGKKNAVKFSNNAILDLFLRHYGDIFASFFLIWVLAYNFAPTTELGAIFVVMPHNTTQDAPNGNLFDYNGD